MVILGEFFVNFWEKLHLILNFLPIALDKRNKLPL